MRPFLPIEEPGDPAIAAYRDIKERDLRGRGGRFVIEGEVVLATALSRGRFAIESILLAENRVAPLTTLIAGVPDHVPVHVAPRAILDAIAGFPMHRGVLAIGLRGEDEEPAAAIARLPAAALVMVLHGIANHDNMGGLMRNAAAFGVDLVLIDGTSCDPLYRKAIRVSAGGALVVPFARGGSVETIADGLAKAGFELVATSPHGRHRLADHRTAARTAVLLGAEGAGLPDALLARCHGVRIDMAGGFDSLNVATASGIVLHWLRERLE